MVCWLLKLDECTVVLLSPSLSASFETKASETIYCSRDDMSNLSCARGGRSRGGGAWALKWVRELYDG